MLHAASELSYIGEMSYAAYDRPPLSKTVLAGWLPAEHSTLPQTRGVAAEWLLGVPASCLNLAGRRVASSTGGGRVAICVRVSKEDQNPEKRGWWRLGPTDDEKARVS